MHRSFISMRHWLVLLFGCSLAASTLAQNLSALAGTWKIIYFDTPSRLTLGRDGDGDVTNIFERNRFVTGVGDLTINANGTLSGSLEGSFTGTLSVTGEGLVTANIEEPDEEPPPPVIFTVNAAQDVMIGVSVEADSNETLVCVKLPASVSEAEVTGDWGIRAFETPRTLTLLTDADGDINNIPEKDHFGVYNGTLTVNAGGTLSGNVEGPFSGNYAMPSPGVVSVTIPGETSMTLYMNASKDFMAAVTEHVDFNSQELTLFTKTPTATTLADLAGHWRVVYMDAPPGLDLTFDAEGDLTDIPNRNHFEIAHQHLTAGTDGFFTAQFDGPKTGAMSVLSPGAIQVTVNTKEGPEVVTLRLNAARNTLIGVLQDSYAQEVILATKAPPSAASQRQFGLMQSVGANGVLDFYWAAQPGRVLQSNADLGNPSGWQNVEGTDGQHSHSVNAGSAGGQRFFRVVETE